MIEQQQHIANIELARRMGITESRWQSRCWTENHIVDGICEDSYCQTCDKLVMFSERTPPNYFNNHTAAWELVIWLKLNFIRTPQIRFVFCESLMDALGIKESWDKSQLDESDILELLIAEPSVVARAACKALGIEVSDGKEQYVIENTIGEDHWKHT